MKILITGGAGFLGQRLARGLLEHGRLALGGAPEPITQIDLLDVTRSDAINDTRVRSVQGDIADPAVLDASIDADTAAVFHLAAIVSGQAEADFDLGMRINLDASRALLEACRQRGHRPRVVFTSSVAVYGGALPETVRDDTALNPQSSYGTQKAIAELLLADYTRRGFVDGRALRLPLGTVEAAGTGELLSRSTSDVDRLDFTVRWSSETAAVTAKQYRILLGDRIYNIVHVDDMGFKRNSRKFHAELTER